MIKVKLMPLVTRNDLKFNIKTFELYIVPLLLMIPVFFDKKGT